MINDIKILLLIKPDIFKNIVHISEFSVLCPSDTLFFILSLLEEGFPNTESPL